MRDFLDSLKYLPAILLAGGLMVAIALGAERREAR
jgi:hypothetical protein